MGMGCQGLQFALLGKRRGVKFDRTLTLGRQNHYVDDWWVRTLFDRFKIRISEEEVNRTVAEPFADALLSALGASLVDSMDVSAYEGATILHDLNLPVPDALKQRYTCVMEYGTLEHVFNFPVALKNTVDMIEVGGHLLVITPANNMMGHGFYQFSPELYYNFLFDNGFKDVEAYMIPYRWLPHIFRVAEPEDLRDRVELVNSEPMQLGVIARKAKHLTEMVVPIQSDYRDLFWRGRERRQRIKLPIKPQLAAALAELRKRIAALNEWPETLSPQLVAGLENRAHYRMIDPATD
jgi:hypothetical protein